MKGYFSIAIETTIYSESFDIKALSMNPLAESLNATISAEAPHLFEMLSELGKRFYFPSKGILSQSAEAKKKATRFNATIGTALEDGTAMHLDCLMEQLPGISANDALLYASSPGNQKLREAWQAKDLKDNPDLVGKPCSLPVVTGGLSHALSLIADLIVDPGDLFLYPDKNWGNYRLNFVERKGAEPKFFQFFKGNGFNVEAFRQALDECVAAGRKKIIVLLNFPNNPTGYSPTDAENCAIAQALKETADKGVNLAVIVDDAYYGLFFKPEVTRQSLFTKLAGLHPRILAFKADAATKEVYVWGLRVGFVSFSIGGVASGSPVFEAVNSKMAGIIRSVVSNCSALSQFLVLNALKSPDFFKQRAAKAEIMRQRALKVEEALQNPEYAQAWEVYPFNSGYFMCLKIKDVNASDLRIHLLDNYGIGTIAINDTDLRIAFSCIEAKDVHELFRLIFQGWKDLAKQN